MTNITITVSEDVLRRARVRAAGQGTSVSAILRQELARYASGSAERAADTFLALARAQPGDSARGERWSRDDLHLERFDRRRSA